MKQQHKRNSYSNCKIILFFLFLLFFKFSFSQNTTSYKYWNPAGAAMHFIEGQGWPGEVKYPYDRLPARVETEVRKPVWDLSKNSAGLSLRFTTDASEVIVKYVVAGSLQMLHMPATGVSGVDLYAKNEDDAWLWCAGKASFGDTITYRFNNLQYPGPLGRTFTLFLPLYKTVKWLEIGVPQKNFFNPLPVRNEKPVVVYGTSIAQGACASRPGLGWTSILSRKLNVPVTNLGFSGNGKLDKEVIKLLGEIDAKLYVLDCLPNMTPPYFPADTLRQRLIDAVTYLHKTKPNTPILLTEHDGYTDEAINPVHKQEYTDANNTLNEVFTQLKKKGFKNIFLLSKKEIAQDIETMVDGVHPNDAGMIKYANAYEKKINTIFKKSATVIANAKPSLIPLPQQLVWNKGFFPLIQCKTILVKDTLLLQEANRLQESLAQKGIAVSITGSVKKDQPFIELALANIPAPQLKEEAYKIEINAQKNLLSANTPKGIFYAAQTLEQLITNNQKVVACTITDWPAFAWRGYMVDVGRNFQSMGLLKQQIQIMSRYKFNVFHFHFTEDIAWRLASKQYPQLTAPENMLRNKGSYYSEEDLKELIRFCKDRYITLVPEMDMPGHSAAFKRAMKWDMQSDSGMVILKNILKEFFETYDVPYFHIGADEVKITNKNFVPEITTYVESFGKKTVGWEPGGNFKEGTIRQLWMDDNAHTAANTHIQFIDSRHLYINHMDPLESVVTIFNRQIGKKEIGDSAILGGTLCLWPDRRVEREEDVLIMNAAYPALLAFAERTWRGGGHKGWVANIGELGTAGAKEFGEFENRLLDHKDKYFSSIPFPYVKQSNITWKVFGPYPNEGNLAKSFLPESKTLDGDKTEAAFEAVGGTIVLRHWWYPLIEGAIKEPKENTTWYATRKVWSNEDGYKSFWIGFNNLSRSPATDSPPEGAWDNKQSTVWVNGKAIEPPHWKRAGQKGSSEIPLIDEGYEYRAPAKILLQKGWNTVLLKAPVGSFKGKDWQNPVKWMFTFLEISE
jgi:lysophospholipase L1-like esterase